MNPRFLPLLLTSLVVLRSQNCVSQNGDYQTCRPSFQCGRLTRISYPFWGGNRPVACGHPGFELACQGNDDPLLNISSVTYRVLAVDLSTQTLRVSRNDLLGNLCSTPSFNSTLDFKLFDYYLPANDQNISIYYGCTLPDPRPAILAPNYQLTCNPNGVSLFATSAMSQQVNGTLDSCSNNIYVPVNETSARDLGDTTIASEDRLRASLESGFSIQYLADNQNCIDCAITGGVCGYNRTSTSLACYSPSTGDGNGTCFPFLAGKNPLPTDGQLVAVKVLTETSDDAEEFVNEVASISRTSHVNIVNLLGFCYDRKRRALIYEFMPNKSLDNFIYKRGSANRECSLEWEKLYEIAVGVARGLEYLHRGCNTRIVHFDIKPQNILLDEDFCPKISDFGLARLFKNKQSIMSTFGPRGTIGYIAPEVFFRSFGVVSHKSDVYSYGMTLLEMSEARKIVGNEAIQSSENYFPDKIYEYVLNKKENLGDLITEEKEETKRKMLVVGLWCIQTAPSDRPSMTKVVEMLEGSLQSIQVPPKPFLFSPQLSVQQFSSSVSRDLLHELC